LADPEVRRWLNGIEPAWTMLDFGSYTALRQESLPGNEAIRLQPGLTEPDLIGSAVLRATRCCTNRSPADAGSQGSMPIAVRAPTQYENSSPPNTGFIPKCGRSFP